MLLSAKVGSSRELDMIFFIWYMRGLEICSELDYVLILVFILSKISYNNLMGKTGFLIFLFIIFISLFLFLLGGPIRNLFYLLSENTQITFLSLGNKISERFMALSAKEKLYEQNKTILAENKNLESELVRMSGLEQENKFLRETLELGLQNDFRLLLSDIISKDSQDDFLVINKGEKNGISKGMTVIDSRRILVGSVSEVWENFSRVTLITNKAMSFPAKIEKNNIIAKVEGKNNGQFFLDFIPREEEIEEGYNVVTTSLENIFPKNLLVGKIGSIEKSDLNIYQQAELIPAFDFKDLMNVFVVLGYGN